MEVILISDDKVKITLTEEDLREFAIDCDAAEEDGELCRRFKDVLCRADDICGTSLGASRVLVQLFQSRDGGCELFVTRLSPALPTGASGAADGTVYVFNSLGALVAACRLLNTRGYGAHSAAFSTDGGEYALLLPEFPSDAPVPLAAACLDEYGVRRTDEKTRLYISEHARTICADGAAEILSKF
jgi:negative regulator of genetic competence, sporulation and motility